MADMWRQRVTWGGTPVTGPGLSTFYWAAETDGIVAAVEAAFQAVRGSVPAGVTWTIPAEGETIDAATGALTGAWSQGTGVTVTSTGSPGTFAAGVGARIAWQTGQIHGSRRVRGSTFIVPLITASYDTAGTLGGEAPGALAGFVTAMLGGHTAGSLVIWSRPKPGLAGAAAAVVSGAAPDKVSWLLSRRT